MFIVLEKLSIVATTGGARVGQNTIAKLRDSIMFRSLCSVTLHKKQIHLLTCNHLHDNGAENRIDMVSNKVLPLKKKYLQTTKNARNGVQPL